MAKLHIGTRRHFFSFLVEENAGNLGELRAGRHKQAGIRGDWQGQAACEAYSSDRL
jgi:hypothetical protein